MRSKDNTIKIKNLSKLIKSLHMTVKSKKNKPFNEIQVEACTAYQFLEYPGAF